jgi:hypothetical protein
MPAREKTQNYANHARYFPLFHFLASPVTGFYFVHSVVHAVQYPSGVHWLEALYAAAIFAGVLGSRVMALTVQNRVIRLEMRRRLKELLPPAMHARIRELTVRQLVALRFAGDAEIPSLVDRVLKGEFEKPRDIKRAITDWQADYLRA